MQPLIGSARHGLALSPRFPARFQGDRTNRGNLCSGKIKEEGKNRDVKGKSLAG